MPSRAVLVDLADALLSRREEILSEWVGTLTAGKRPLESGLTNADLRNQIAKLLSDLSAALQSPLPEEPTWRAMPHAEELGETRWAQRYQIQHVLGEIGTLRTSVVDFIVSFTDQHPEFSSREKRAAHRIVHRFFDSVVVDSASLFVARQQHATLEHEHERVAQELHDGLCQHLQGTALMAESLRRELEGTGFQKRVEAIGKLIQEAADDARKMAHDISPVVMAAEGGLQNALEKLAQKATGHGLMACTFKCSTNRLVPKGIGLHLYRIVQAALSNSLTHSRATQVMISLEESKNCFVVTVADNGRGYASEKHEFEGMGLHNIRHRAHAIGASVRFDSSPHGGTRVVCAAPLEISRSTDWQ